MNQKIKPRKFRHQDEVDVQVHKEKRQDNPRNSWEKERQDEEEEREYVF